MIIDLLRPMKTGPRARKTPRQIFFEQAGERPIAGCWNWPGKLYSNGYGRFRVIGKELLAHRISFEVHTGVTPTSNQVVCHKCDNPRCINPDHLFIGTHRDNALDMISKGRGNPATGFRNHRCKLSDDDVSKIRQSVAAGVSRKNLASTYGVSVVQITRVFLGSRRLSSDKLPTKNSQAKALEG